MRRQMLDGPFFIFTYYWRGRFPYTYEFDLSGSGCEQRMRWERVATVHTLDRGNDRVYEKGWKVNADLSWDNGLIRREYEDTDAYAGRTEQLLGLLFNTKCNSTLFYFPSPGLHPTKYYNVRIGGDYTFTYARGLEGIGLQGGFSLIGKDVLDEIPWTP